MRVNLITLFNFCFGVNHNPEVALRISSDVYNTLVLHTPKDVLWDEIRIVNYTKIRIEKGINLSFIYTKFWNNCKWSGVN